MRIQITAPTMIITTRNSTCFCASLIAMAYSLYSFGETGKTETVPLSPMFLVPAPGVPYDRLDVRVARRPAEHPVCTGRRRDELGRIAGPSW